MLVNKRVSKPVIKPVIKRTLTVAGWVLSASGVAALALALLTPSRVSAATHAAATQQLRPAASAAQSTDPGMPRDEGITQLPASGDTQLPATPDTPRPHYDKPPRPMP